MIEAGIQDADAFAIDRVTERDSGDADFYFTGSGQLLILWSTDPDGMRERLLSLATSAGPEEGIFSLFAARFENPEAGTRSP